MESRVVYSEFSKVFNTDFHNILIDKLLKCGLYKWTVTCNESWIDRPTLFRSVTESPTESQSLAVYHRGWHWVQNDLHSGQSIPSASLHLIQTLRNEWYFMTVFPFKRAFERLPVGRNLMKFNKENAKCFSGGGITPCTSRLLCSFTCDSW